MSVHSHARLLGLVKSLTAAELHHHEAQVHVLGGGVVVGVSMRFGVGFKVGVARGLAHAADLVTGVPLVTARAKGLGVATAAARHHNGARPETGTPCGFKLGPGLWCWCQARRAPIVGTVLLHHVVDIKVRGWRRVIGGGGELVVVKDRQHDENIQQDSFR